MKTTDQPGEHHNQEQVQAALTWAEAEAETRRKCGHDFIAGKLTTMAAHCRRLEQRVAELEPKANAMGRWAERAGVADGKLIKAEAALVTSQKERDAYKNAIESNAGLAKELYAADLAAAQAEREAFLRYGDDMSQQLAAARRQLEEMSAFAAEVHSDMFAQCLSNGVFDAWGKPVNCTKLNQLQNLAEAVVERGAEQKEAT